jgi:hypothetical protein
MSFETISAIYFGAEAEAVSTTNAVKSWEGIFLFPKWAE